jgi:RHS repeat-associated protein
LTEFLYSGEQFDSKIGQQYLRARYYDPTTGRFNRLDPFLGNLSDPQSLHKYLYTHADPVNGIDPSGEMLAGMIGSLGISRCMVVTALKWTFTATMTGLTFYSFYNNVYEASFAWFMGNTSDVIWYTTMASVDVLSFGVLASASGKLLSWACFENGTTVIVYEITEKTSTDISEAENSEESYIYVIAILVSGIVITQKLRRKKTSTQIQKTNNSVDVD